MARIHWRALKGSTKLAGQETVVRGVLVQLGKGLRSVYFLKDNVGSV